MTKNLYHSPRPSHGRPRHRRQAPKRKRGFLLIMVLLVISTLSLAALNFSDSMLIAHEAARLDSKRFQARMMVESGIQAARLFVASPPALRTEMGGSWDNPQKFQALNIVPDVDPTFRGNVTFIAPSLDQSGAIGGIRYGLQNESAKLNLNALVELDKLAKTIGAASAIGGSSGQGGPGAAGAGQGGGPSSGGPGGGNGGGNGGGSAGQANNNQQPPQTGGVGTVLSVNPNRGSSGGAGGAGGGGGSGASGGGFGGSSSGGGFGSGGLAGGAGALASLAEGGSQDIASKMLLGLPGMTPDVADAILDFIDADEEPRTYGAEYADYYQQMQPAYKPPNGPLASIEQLLLVRGVTPQLLFGFDQNRNGVIDASEQSQMLSGVPAGGAAGTMPMPMPTASSATGGSEGQPSMPGPLGWAPYLTLHSQEKNVAADGTKRININGDDLQTLYDELTPAVGELWASYIIAYRIGGQPPPGAGSPLQALLTAAASTNVEGGMMGAQLSAMANNSPQGLQAGNGQQGGQQPGGQQPGGNQQKKAWTAAGLASVDLSQQQGSVKFTQILDLVDSSVTIPAQGGQGQGGQAQGGQGQAGQAQGGQGGNSYSSPISSSPLALADALPVLMDKLTTVDAEALPGRINIMECPRDILAGVPGMTTELVDAIIQARVDGSETENRRFETWLAVEGLVTIDQMRGFMPLMTCGGDVFKAQVIGYYEGSASFCRAEAIISGVGATPTVLFYRRLDHLDRGFDVPTLGQRMDVGSTPTMVQR